MTELTAVLAAFKTATGFDAAVWTQVGGETGTLTRAAATNQLAPPSKLPAMNDGPVAIDAPEGPSFAAGISGPRRAWLVVSAPKDAARQNLDAQTRFLLPVVTQILQSALEVEHAANELAERYEEINLLYTISEILGRTVALEEVSGRILTEVSETVGARAVTLRTRPPLATRRPSHHAVPA